MCWFRNLEWEICPVVSLALYLHWFFDMRGGRKKFVMPNLKANFLDSLILSFVCVSVCVCDCASEPIAQVYSEWSEMFIFSSDAQMATKFGREQVANGVTSVQEHLGIKDHTDKRAHMMRCGLHAPLTTHSLTHAPAHLLR